MNRILKKSIYVVAGARPNFMKIAPLIKDKIENKRVERFITGFLG